MRWRGWMSAIIAIVMLYLFTLPDVESLRTKVPLNTALSRARGDAALHIDFISFGSIPQVVRKAVIVAEDANFASHSGIDFSEVWESIKDAVLDLSAPRGASTITQQLAKNLYLSESYNPLRKIKEYLIARRLERTLSKRRIFELYMNVIEWGPHIYGLNAASRYYFKKNGSEINREEAAFLAAIIPGPTGVFNPTKNRERVAQRKQLLLRRMELSSVSTEF